MKLLSHKLFKNYSKPYHRLLTEVFDKILESYSTSHIEVEVWQRLIAKIYWVIKIHRVIKYLKIFETQAMILRSFFCFINIPALRAPLVYDITRALVYHFYL